MRIMISQPMNGKTNEQIKEERKELVDELEKQGHTVINTIFDFNKGGGEKVSSMFYLAKSIEAMDKVDAVIFMKGWENARGCVAEEYIAKKYGKFVKYL